MSDVDAAPIMRQGPTGVNITSPSSAILNHPSQAKVSSRDVAMKRDRSRDGRDGSRGRGRAEQNHRGSASNIHSRLRSSSPGVRPSQNHRGRDRKYHGGEGYGENSEVRVDERRRGRSPDRRERYYEDTRRVKDFPIRDSHLDSGKRRDGSSSPRHRSRIDDYLEHPRDRSFSPPSRKRPRSRSPLPFPPSRSKRSKRERERDRRRRVEREERFERDHPEGPVSSRLDRPHSPSRRRSISPHYDAPHHRYSDRVDAPDAPRHRHRSRSPPREAISDDHLTKNPTRPRVDSKIRDRSRSPRPSSRRSSFSHTHSPPRSIGRLPPRGPSDVGAHSRRSSPTFEPSRVDHPPRSPRDRGSRRSRKKAKYREEPRLPPGGPLASGANSIEVNTFRRGDRRNSFESPEPLRDSVQEHPDDSLTGQATPHVNLHSPHQGSPASPRPYVTTRIRKGDDPPYSPRSQHLSRERSYPVPTGPSGRQASSQSPPRPPTGPMAQSSSRGRGFSRGGFRGGMASARDGLSDDTSRHNKWTESTGSNRGPSSPGNITPVRSSTPSLKDEDRAMEDLPRPRRDDELEDSLDERTATEQMPPPRPPPTAPTGPASSKFSFAFKTSTKNPVAAPKPEISQKFSAAPKKDTQPIIDDRDRDLPKDTPREPASARARADYHHSRAPPEQPRTRKVTKTRRKLKPKPPLDPELAQSVSVYFRKPGNESVIGSGTYGKVFKGTHVYTKRLVALKRIRMEGEKDGFPVTAMREVKLLQSLRHPNIVHLHEVMIERNECYMVFEYLSHDLTGLLNHPSYKLDAAQRKHLAQQLFEGLDYLHKRGVLHRDIKAANILVSSDGIMKLADFGLARFYAKRHQLDYTNRVITIWYRSPELLLGETQYGAAVDIWSAACVMVEIFTRHAIFPGDGGEISQLEKIYNVLGTPNRREWPGLVDTPWFELLRPGYRKPNVFAEKYRERLPAAAFDLLAEMFQYDPLKRPSAADVLEHPYFTIEQPPPRQAIELKDIKGDWHEFESKALRREKEKQEKQQREARRAAAAKDGSYDRERKRPPSSHESQPESKRSHLEGPRPSLSREPSSAALPLSENLATEIVAD
ncbi:Pkinase-domain-containing protein [Xylariaceae sp. FL1651]|nr:Pkinase-domain-containing protein [Xylariaceae sp. FL1651]